MARTTSPINSVSPAWIAEAARLIRAGKLVAFPTETVYGLGANALDETAVRAIYTAKKRPSSSPLIVHADSVEMARSLVTSWPENAEKLAARFWPGPLTLVLPKQEKIPGCVTAGLDTVGVRIPNHPVALALIRAARVPLAAPSANLFTGLSPTEAGHVRTALGDRVAMVLDGGPSKVGLESTVLSLAGPAPVLLRPGMISREAIEAVIGPVHLAGADPAGSAPHSSPGMHPRHYSPRTRLVLLGPGEMEPAGNGVVLRLNDTGARGHNIAMPRDPETYAAALYRTLHTLDAGGWDWIAVEAPPDEPDWAAIRDRLKRAATS
ncbi:MAG TPA: L-threonylcarbamoyladenylate synthase [Bryobacteraceae bacterium]|jgi:L-threonylcarbamoyladenylate synthase|nr:L-threonylcarbamoyladenylate synthase [Bryobacteraceae bacterium]